MDERRNGRHSSTVRRRLQGESDLPVLGTPSVRPGGLIPPYPTAGPAELLVAALGCATLLISALILGFVLACGLVRLLGTRQ